jgi:hypothetical protein
LTFGCFFIFCAELAYYLNHQIYESDHCCIEELSLSIKVIGQELEMSLPPTTFSEASHIQSLGTHQYGVVIHPDFAWGSVAHGGYLFSLLWKVIAEHYRTTLASYDQPDTVAMHVELLRPTALGEAVVQVKDARLGKGSSTLHVALVQGGKERVVGYAT